MQDNLDSITHTIETSKLRTEIEENKGSLEKIQSDNVPTAFHLRGCIYALDSLAVLARAINGYLGTKYDFAQEGLSLAFGFIYVISGANAVAQSNYNKTLLEIANKRLEEEDVANYSEEEHYKDGEKLRKSAFRGIILSAFTGMLRGGLLMTAGTLAESGLTELMPYIASNVHSFDPIQSLRQYFDMNPARQL